MKSFKDSIQKGSMMVEALALLGLITMVTPILYKKAAERTTELQDINIATQMRMLSTAVDDYISDNYKAMGDAHPGSEAVFAISGTELDKLKAYLPHGFNMDNSKMFNAFQVKVRKTSVTDLNGKERNAFTSAVLAPLKDNLTIMRTSKIASMIGANGGVYRAATGKLDGTQGTWQAAPDDFGITTTGIKDGSLVVLSNDVIDAAKGGVSPDKVLYRVDDSDIDKNTMETTLYMGGHPIRDVTNIIAASGADVTIGKADEPSNLVVTGATNLAGLLTAQSGIKVVSGGVTVDSGDITASAGNLNISGNGTFGGNLSVAGTGYFGGQLTANSGLVVNNGSTLNGGVTISGALNQSGGDVSLSGDNLKANFGNVAISGSTLLDLYGGNVKVVGGSAINMSAKDVNVNATNKVNISGNNGVRIQAGTKYVDINPTTGTTVNGDLIVQSGNLILGSGQTLTADHIVANVDLKVGSGCVLNSAGLITCKEMNIGELGAYANASGLSVGKTMADTSGHKLRVEKGGTAFIGYSYATSNAHKGLLVNTDQADLRMGHARLVLENNATAANAWAMMAADTARLHAQNGTVYIGVGDWRNEDTRVYATASEAGMKTPSSSLYMTSGGALKFATGNSGSSTVGIVADQYGISFGSGIDGGALASTGEGAIITGSGRTVAISRSGVLEVKNEEGALKGHNSGFIRANRMVSHKNAPSFYGGTYTGGAVQTPYDKYQVNPAYTSVMNDIKLATRGGARLSDILPDYINKGVYIADNTYKENVGAWASLVVSNSGKVTTSLTGKTCINTSNQIDSTCVSSPWLGFLPTAQCPPMYARAVSVTPMKWRMSEVYHVQGIDALSDDALKTALSSSFRGSGNFIPLGKDPRNAGALLSGVVAQSGVSHTHGTLGTIGTFQTNTWLNTTMSPVGGTGADFKGWHIVMGFLYWPNQFTEAVNLMGVSDEIVWNLFPTFAGEMAAVANVYCVFDRIPLSGDQPWGGNASVYKYDQLDNYHAGYTKDDTWSEAVNDPTLGYDDVW